MQQVDARDWLAKKVAEFKLLPFEEQTRLKSERRADREAFEKRVDSPMKLVDEMYSIMEQEMQKQLDAPDWVMRDIPWITIELYQQFLETVGEDNIKIISGSRMQRKTGDVMVDSIRQSVLISPEGIERLKNASN